MLAIDECGFDLDRPFSAAVGLALECQCVIAVNDDLHDRPWSGGARKRWRGVVGDAIVDECSGVVVGVLRQCASNIRDIWGRRIDREGFAGDDIAGIASGIGKENLWGVFAIREVCFDGE